MNEDKYDRYRDKKGEMSKAAQPYFKLQYCSKPLNSIKLGIDNLCNKHYNMFV